MNQDLLLIKLGLIKGFNLKLKKTEQDFYESLSKMVDFSKPKSILTAKRFIGRKYVSSFVLRHRGKADNKEIVCRFKKRNGGYTQLKVRITLHVWPLFFLLFVFLGWTLAIGSLAVEHDDWLLLLAIVPVFLMAVYFFFIYRNEAKSVSKELNKIFRTL